MNTKRTMLIKNKENKEISTLKFATSYFSRLLGLMFKKDVDYILVFENKSKNKENSYLINSAIPSAIDSTIHTLFMRFTIDLIFLDKDKKVFEIATVPPWKYYKPEKSASYILEAKKGFIKESELAIGDELDFICEMR